MIPQQYDSKVIPKKISKLKKYKETGGSSTFYTDLSDMENCDLAAESVESLATQPQPEPTAENIGNNLEKIVSELLMQNQEFNKVSVWLVDTQTLALYSRRKHAQVINFHPAWH